MFTANTMNEDFIHSGGVDEDHKGDEEEEREMSPSRPPEQSLVDDLSCPICMSLLRDPFVTACGHTFCCSCLTTHLNARTTCPSCAQYLIKDNTFPNFMLSKVRRPCTCSLEADFPLRLLMQLCY